MTIRNGYEVSSEGAVRHWEMPFARLANATPTPTDPERVLAATAGNELTGTVLTTDTINNVAVIDFTHSMVYRHNVRNVLTYGGGPAEATWGAINIGDVVYYDDTATMPVDYHLSLSPLDGAGNANPIFGHVVAANDAEVALFPLGAGGVAASFPNVAIMQEGA